MQGNSQDRVEYLSRGSLRADESPPKDDAFVWYELDNLALEPADVGPRLDMQDAKVAADAPQPRRVSP
jgi:hypothetical protein